jgi:hypothetical protein
MISVEAESKEMAEDWRSRAMTEFERQETNKEKFETKKNH